MGYSYITSLTNKVIIGHEMVLYINPDRMLSKSVGHLGRSFNVDLYTV